MQPYRSEPRGFPATDPATGRLTRDEVIAIHNAHIEGVAWDEIALRHGTNRHNILRIVQGRRWRTLHPNVSPELYDETIAAPPATTSVDPVVEIVNTALRDARDKILKELREAA